MLDNWASKCSWDFSIISSLTLNIVCGLLFSVWYHFCSLHDSVILLNNRAAELGHKIKKFPEDEKEKISYIGSKRLNMKYDCIVVVVGLSHTVVTFNKFQPQNSHVERCWIRKKIRCFDCRKLFHKRKILEYYNHYDYLE